MSTQIVRLNSSPLAVQLPPITRMDMVQPSSEEGREGSFRDTSSGKQHKTIEVCIIWAGEHRVLWPEAIGVQAPQGRKYICRSSDGIAPASYIENPPAPTCAECPHSKWNGKRSACRQKAVMIFGVPKLAGFYVISVPGTSFGEVVDINARIQDAIVKHAMKGGRKIETWELLVTLRVVKGTKRGFKYFVLDAVPPAKFIKHGQVVIDLYRQVQAAAQQIAARRDVE